MVRRPVRLPWWLRLLRRLLLERRLPCPRLLLRDCERLLACDLDCERRELLRRFRNDAVRRELLLRLDVLRLREALPPRDDAEREGERPLDRLLRELRLDALRLRFDCERAPALRRDRPPARTRPLRAVRPRRAPR